MGFVESSIILIRRRQFSDEVILKCALGQLVLGWQEGFGQIPGAVITYQILEIHT